LDSDLSRGSSYPAYERLGEGVFNANEVQLGMLSCDWSFAAGVTYTNLHYNHIMSIILTIIMAFILKNIRNGKSVTK